MWPGDARVALWVSPNVEHYEFVPPPSATYSSFTRVPAPDVQQWGVRDFGNRVGFWRMAAVLDEFDIRATVSLNLSVLDHYPEVYQAMEERGWAYMSHGLVNTTALYDYTEVEERAFLRRTMEILEGHTGHKLKGMLGPALSSTLHTPDLLAEEGFLYTADWPIDDQPVPIATRYGRLVSVPYSYELNDRALGSAGDMGVWAARCKAQFDRLWSEGQDGGRVMCLALHPFAIGQPQMVHYLREVLEYVTGRDGVWYTTADEIAEHYLAHCYEDHVRAAEMLVATDRGAAG